MTNQMKPFSSLITNDPQLSKGSIYTEIRKQLGPICTLHLVTGYVTAQCDRKHELTVIDEMII